MTQCSGFYTIEGLC